MEDWEYDSSSELFSAQKNPECVFLESHEVVILIVPALQKSRKMKKKSEIEF